MKDKDYYEQFNRCENIKNAFDYLTIPQAALIWCGIPRDQISFELKQCLPKGDTNAQERSTFVHPYIECVEPRCTVLHKAFEKAQLKMGRNGGDSDYIYGEKDKCEEDGINLLRGVRHINPEKRTIKINDLKEFIQEYHPDDMPKTLFSEIDISKASPITHEDYLTLKLKNEALNVRLEKAKDTYREQKSHIESLENKIRILSSQQPSEDDLKAVPHQSYRTVDRIMYALAKLTKIDNSSPYSQNTNTLNEAILTTLQNDGIPLEYEAIGKWLTRANEIQAIKKE